MAAQLDTILSGTPQRRDNLASLPRPTREHLWTCALECGWAGNDPALSDAAFTRFNPDTGIDERVPLVVELCPACGAEAEPLALLRNLEATDLPEREPEPSKLELIEALRAAQTLRPTLLRQYGQVPECVLEFCNRARALLARWPR